MSPFDRSLYDLEPSFSDFAVEHIEHAFEECSHEHKYSTYNDVALSEVQSPLEAAFFGCWSVYSHFRWPGFTLVPQWNVVIGGRKYRLDFIVVPDQTIRDRFKRTDEPPIRVAVELDGHEFHERTRAQVQRRDQRDRVLTGDGWRVLHFSWGEFNADPYKCFSETYWAAHSADAIPQAEAPK